MTSRIALGNRSQLAAIALVLVSLSAWGCGNSGSGSDIPNISQSAAPLDNDGQSYSGPLMETSRYGHTATALNDSKVLISGGTDERHLTSIETAEVFDQTLFADPQPESISGDFVDTDVNGDPITMSQGGRVYHTATRVADGTVLIAGGSRDNLISEAIRQAELFDPQTRLFNPAFLMINTEMYEARFRHAATLLPSGRVLFTGGQVSVDETIIDDNFPPGHPLFQVDVETFPSTELVEVYDPSSREFFQAVNISGGVTTMVTPRGRSNLGAGRVGGFDNRLNTGDDIIVFVGGFQTLSSLFAPQTKFPNQGALSNQTGVEYLDTATGLLSSAANVQSAERSNDPLVRNLGVFRSTTIDGVEGVTNLLLITHGDNNGLCRVSNGLSEVMSMTFTGFGPANGILFANLDPPTIHALAGDFPFDPDFLPDLIPLNNYFGGFDGGTAARSEADAVLLPAQRVYDGQLQTSNWVLTAGGATMTCPMGMQVEDLEAPRVVNSFDPFFRTYVATDAFGAPLPGDDTTFWTADDPADSPWDQSLTRNLLFFGTDDLNPTGIVGTWLVQDQLVPDNNLVGFRSGFPPAALRFGRAYNTLTTLAGQDGIINTFDERLLVAGGGVSVIQYGGEPISQSSEIYLPVGANGVMGP